MKTAYLTLLLALCCSGPPRPPARLKDLVAIEGVRENQLIGYGLVVGLAGTGDRRQTMFSAQSLTNMLERMGVTVSPTAIRVNEHRGGDGHRDAARHSRSPGRASIRPSRRSAIPPICRAESWC